MRIYFLILYKYDTLISDFNDYIHSFERELHERKFINKTIANTSGLGQLSELSPSLIEIHLEVIRKLEPEIAISIIIFRVNSRGVSTHGISRGVLATALQVRLRGRGCAGKSRITSL